MFSITFKYPVKYNMGFLPKQFELFGEINEQNDIEEDSYNSIFASSKILEHVYTKIKVVTLDINGYNLNWDNYIYYISNIMADIPEVLCSLDNGINCQLDFYEQGAERIIKFNVKDDIVISDCFDMMDDTMPIGSQEVFQRKYLVSMLNKFKYDFFYFSKNIYPEFSDKYLISLSH